MKFLNQKQIEVFGEKDKGMFRVSRGRFQGMRIGVIFLIILIFFFLNLSPVSERIKGFFYSFSKNFQAWFWEQGGFVSGFLESMMQIQRFQEARERLDLQDQELLAKNMEIEQLRKENEALRTALDLGLKQEFDLVVSQVIGKDTSEDFLMIDKGYLQGISLGFPVIGQQKSLIGKISEVYENVSKIQLLTSENSSFDVKVLEREVYGLVKGKGNFNLLLDLIPKEEEIEVGDKVITSVLGGNFPNGLLVGEIKKIEKSDVKSFQEAEIKPSFEIRQLDHIFIITNFNS